MLLEFGAKNFFSFKEGFEVSLRLNNNCPDNISKGRNCSTISCIKGSNASGKTNVLKALSFFHFFCTQSFNLKPEDPIGMESFFKNSDPSDFFIVFEVDGIEYRYELEVDNKKIISETLYQKQKRYTKVIERNYNNLDITVGKYSELKIMKLRDNASLINTSKQYELKCLDSIYDFFNSILTNVNFFGIVPLTFNVDEISKIYSSNLELFNFVVDIIKKCDLGISNIEISSRENEKGEKIFYPIFHHDLGSKQIKTLLFQNQSGGTKTLYRLLALYYIVLFKGGILVFDEFDINLHPHILPLLIDLFEDEKSNKHNGQLIFTTHNSEIMDKLGKYRTVLLNKEFNSSYAYRLDELPGDLVRNDRPITPIYNLGKIGGVPKL